MESLLIEGELKIPQVYFSPSPTLDCGGPVAWATPGLRIKVLSRPVVAKEDSSRSPPRRWLLLLVLPANCASRRSISFRSLFSKAHPFTALSHHRGAGQTLPSAQGFLHLRSLNSQISGHAVFHFVLFLSLCVHIPTCLLPDASDASCPNRSLSSLPSALSTSHVPAYTGVTNFHLAASPRVPVNLVCHSSLCPLHPVCFSLPELVLTSPVPPPQISSRAPSSLAWILPKLFNESRISSCFVLSWPTLCP